MILSRKKQKKKQKHAKLHARGVESKRNKNRFQWQSTDWSILFLTIFLLIGGLLMIFSASAIRAHEEHNDTFYYFTFQLFWIAIGLIAMGVLYVIPLSLLKRYSALMLGGSIVLLLYILPEALFGKTTILDDGTIVNSGLQMPFVVAKNGATRWIEIGNASVQPSELVKFSFIIYLAAWLTKDFKIKDLRSPEEHFKKVLLPFTLLIGFVSVLILAQRDFDTTVIIFLTVMTVYFVSGNDRIHTIGSFILLFFSSLFGIFALMVEPYRRSRLKSFVDLFIHGEPSGNDAQADSFQVWNGLVALGSGGLFGVGYGESKQKLGFLQDAAYTDSIFVVIGEEFGLVGAAIVIIGFLYFAVLGFKIAQRADDKFASLIAIGMSVWISIQALLNIASNIALIPFGGMPLPFFTYGGTATITAMMAVGVLLNVSRHSVKETERKFQS